MRFAVTDVRRGHWLCLGSIRGRKDEGRNGRYPGSCLEFEISAGSCLSRVPVFRVRFTISEKRRLICKERVSNNPPTCRRPRHLITHPIGLSVIFRSSKITPSSSS